MFVFRRNAIPTTSSVGAKHISWRRTRVTQQWVTVEYTWCVAAHSATPRANYQGARGYVSAASCAQEPSQSCADPEASSKGTSMLTTDHGCCSFLPAAVVTPRIDGVERDNDTSCSITAVHHFHKALVSRPGNANVCI